MKSDDKLSKKQIKKLEKKRLKKLAKLNQKIDAECDAMIDEWWSTPFEWSNSSDDLREMMNQFGEYYSSRWDSGVIPLISVETGDDRAVGKVPLIEPFGLVGHFLIEIDGFAGTLTCNAKWKTEYVVRRWNSISHFIDDEYNRERMFTILRSLNNFAKLPDLPVKTDHETEPEPDFET